MKTDRILIVGGYGEVGRRLAAQLEATQPNRVIVAGRHPEQASGVPARRVDVDDVASIERALDGVGVVVACVRQREPHLLRAAVRRGIAYTSIAPHERRFASSGRVANANDHSPHHRRQRRRFEQARTLLAGGRREIVMKRTRIASGLYGTVIAAATLLLAGPARAEEAPVSPPRPQEEASVTPSSAPTRHAPPTIVIRDEAPYLFGPRYRSPGLAAALSLTPVPVDLGNLYAENVGWALAYTSAELTLMTGMMWLGAGHMCHDRDRCADWSDVEAGGMVALAVGYVGVKLVSGVHAASAAREFNERAPTRLIPMVTPTSGGVSIGMGASF